MCRAVLSDAPRKNHTWGIRHLARPIRDVGCEGRRESVAEARCRCGSGETWQLVLVKDSCVARKGSCQGLDGIVDWPLYCEWAPQLCLWDLGAMGPCNFY